MRRRKLFEMIGERESIAVVATGADVWRGAANIIPIPDQTTGEQMTLVSTSVNDAAAGSGIRTVYIHYLDGSKAEAVETVTLDGTTPVNTIATDITFIQEIHAASVGAGGVAAGVVSLHQVGTPATVYTVIDIGGNKDLTFFRMVPAGWELHVSNWSSSASGNKPSFVRLRSTDHHGALYDGTPPIYIFKNALTLETASDFRSRAQEERIIVPTGSIIKASVWATQAGGNVACSLSGELISLT